MPLTTRRLGRKAHLASLCHSCQTFLVQWSVQHLPSKSAIDD